MLEVWVDIKGYEGLYKVSNLGRVIALKKTHLSGYVESSRAEFMPTQIVSEKGYLFVFLKSAEGITKKVKVHRLVATHFIENPFNKPEVNHKDGNKINNHILNLEWCTRKENMEHASLSGFIKKGVDNSRSKVTMEQVLEIQNSTDSTRVLAKRYGIGKSCAARIKSGKGGYADYLN